MCRIVFLIISFTLSFYSHAQQNGTFTIEGQLGKILPHTAKILPIIPATTTGYSLSYQHTFQDNKTQKKFYIGVHLHHQDNHSQVLGNLWSLYIQSQWNLYRERLFFELSQGISYATNPYNPQTNYRNIAYGTSLMPSTALRLLYKQPISKYLQFRTTLSLYHHSNGLIKSPNTGTNTAAIGVGISYTPQLQSPTPFDLYTIERPRYFHSIYLATGMSEGHIARMGSKPFLHLGYCFNKNTTGGLWKIGSEVFLSKAIKDLTPYLAEAFPEKNRDPNADWKRVGVFLGYEKQIHHWAIDAKMGYYIYDHYKEQSNLYQKIGLKYYWNEKIAATLSLKTHFANADALEFGIQYDLL